MDRADRPSLSYYCHHLHVITFVPISKKSGYRYIYETDPFSSLSLYAISDLPSNNPGNPIPSSSSTSMHDM